MTEQKTTEVPVSTKKDDSPKVHAEGYHSHNEEMPNSATIAERERLRNQVANEVEVFLAQGGGITEIEDNLRADPPKKPESNYGSRPI